MSDEKPIGPWALELVEEIVTAYWLRYYCTTICTLCGNTGVIDVTEVMSPAGVIGGRPRQWCICPNGQGWRHEAGGDGPTV